MISPTCLGSVPPDTSLRRVTLDSEYELTEEPGAVRLRVTKVAVGPMTEEEAASVTDHGDYRGYGTAIEKLATG